jgi:hypothetical protein
MTDGTTEEPANGTGKRTPARPPERKPGDQETRFSGAARVQIVIEYSGLIALLLIEISALFYIFCRDAMPHVATRGDAPFWEACLNTPTMLLLSGLFFSGMAGGTAFSLKWLYHTVARDLWYKDRVWWRFGVPLMGGVLGVFANFIFSKALGTAFDQTALEPHNYFPACGLSFLIGVFADGVLGSLEKLARKTFGTLEDLGG